jgi:hypothetical protein
MNEATRRNLRDVLTGEEIRDPYLGKIGIDSLDVMHYYTESGWQEVVDANHKTSNSMLYHWLASKGYR